MKTNTYKITLCAVLTALVFVTTAYCSVPIGLGYVHFGDAIIFIACLLIGWWAAIPAALGSMLADIMLGYMFYAPATLIIKALMVVVVMLIIGKKASFGRILLAMIASSLFMQLGYIGYELILFAAGRSEVTDLMEIYGWAALIAKSWQTIFCVPIGALLSKALLKIKFFNVMREQIINPKRKVGQTN